MKTIYLTLITLLISTVGFAQNEIFSGTITDDNGQTLERAYVLVLNADDLSYVTGTVTDEEGNFEFVNLEVGNYVLSVDHISFEEPKILGTFVQNETFTGTITDDSGQTLERAYVLVLDADDLSYVTATVTDEEGNFKFVGLEAGNYVLSVDHISFEEPKILGTLNNEIFIEYLDKLNLKQLGSTSILDSVDDQLAMHDIPALGK